MQREEGTAVVRFIFSGLLFVLSTSILPLSAFAGEATPPPAPAPTDPNAAKPAAEPKKDDPKKDDDKKKEDEKKAAEKKKADAEIVVSATKLETPRTETGASVSRVTAEDVRVNQDDLVGEALRMVPGVVINQSGRHGDVENFRIRGGDSDHVLMLEDGFRVNRFGAGKFYNLEALDPIGIDRIEVVRGAGSTLNGSEAMTGTVNMLTAKGEGRPELTTSFAAGTYGTDRETLQIQGQQGKFSYNVATSHYNRNEATPDNSGDEDFNYAARLDYDINADHTVKLIARAVDHDKGWYEHTASGFGPAVSPPDPNDTIHNQEFLTGFEYRGRPVPIWESVVRIGYYGIDLRNVSISPNLPDPVAFGFANSQERTFAQERRASWELQENVTAYDCKNFRNIWTIGGLVEHEVYNSDDTATFFDSNEYRHHMNYSFYAQTRLEIYDRAFLTGGVRHEETEEFGGHTTGHFDASILIPETALAIPTSDARVFGSVGSAYRAPSFFEFFAGVGNPGLRPETNFAYDVGLEQNFWNRRISLSGTWFHNQFENLVGFQNLPGFQFRTINQGRARTRGFEFEAHFRPLRQLELYGTVNPISTELEQGADMGKRLSRRPPCTSAVRMVAHPLIGLVSQRYDGLDISVEGLQVRGHTDSGPEGGFNPRSHVNGYTRWDAAVSYRFFKGLRAFARVENFTDTHYEDVKTFPGDGSNTLAGIEFKWRF